MSGLVAVVALGLLVFYSWGTVAFWRAASRERIQLLQTLALWSILAALGSLPFFLAALSGEFGLFSIVGGAFALITPLLWQVGRIGSRLQRYGLSWKRLFFGS